MKIGVWRRNMSMEFNDGTWSMDRMDREKQDYCIFSADFQRRKCCKSQIAKWKPVITNGRYEQARLQQQADHMLKVKLNPMHQEIGKLCSMNGPEVLKSSDHAKEILDNSEQGIDRNRSTD
ncbi:unnamed protein product [Caenorhabditis brenneri]